MSDIPGCEHQTELHPEDAELCQENREGVHLYSPCTLCLSPQWRYSRTGYHVESALGSTLIEYEKAYFAWTNEYDNEPMTCDDCKHMADVIGTVSLIYIVKLINVRVRRALRQPSQPSIGKDEAYRELDISEVR